METTAFEIVELAVYIAQHYPRMPLHDILAVIGDKSDKLKGQESYVHNRVHAHVRHRYTEYEALLDRYTAMGMEKETRKQMAKADVRKVIEWQVEQFRRPRT